MERDAAEWVPITEPLIGHTGTVTQCTLREVFAHLGAQMCQPGPPAPRLITVDGADGAPAGVSAAGAAGAPAGGAAGVPAGGAAPPPVDPGVAARSAMARLPIPMPQAQIGPDPNINEWKMAAVGYPLWLWVDDPGEHEITVTEQGITLDLRARRTTTRFVMGDGQQKMCAYTPRWHVGVEPGTPSPGCGYVYQQPSLPQGAYSVTATTLWTVEWSGLGQTGTLPFERTGPPTELPVGELVAVRTG